VQSALDESTDAGVGAGLELDAPAGDQAAEVDPRAVCHREGGLAAHGLGMPRHDECVTRSRDRDVAGVDPQVARPRGGALSAGRSSSRRPGLWMSLAAVAGAPATCSGLA
jgi:hypothetical protein